MEGTEVDNGGDYSSYCRDPPNPKRRFCFNGCLYSSAQWTTSITLLPCPLPSLHSQVSLSANPSRYGYKDIQKENHQAFEQLLIESLEKFIRREAQERSLESDDDVNRESEDEDSGSSLGIAPNGSLDSLGIPLLADYKSDGKRISVASTSDEATIDISSTDPAMSDSEPSLERELSFVRKAKESGVVYLLGHGDIRARKDSWFFKKLVINYFYAFLRKNCRRGTANLSMPHTNLMQVGMTYMV